MERLKIYRAKLQGQSSLQLALDFGTDHQTIDRIVAEVVEEIRTSIRLSVRQQRQLELDRIDTYTSELEHKLRTQCDDVMDPESGKIYRDGVRATTSVIRLLLDLSKQRALLLKLADIEDDVKSEASILFDSLSSVDLDGLETIDDILEYNRKLQKL
jgi:hypothetical protein